MMGRLLGRSLLRSRAIPKDKLDLTDDEDGCPDDGGEDSDPSDFEFGNFFLDLSSICCS